METICKACDSKGCGMIAIFKHPNNVDQMFSNVTGINEICKDDALCIPCYDEMKIAYNFKKKCQMNHFQRRNEFLAPNSRNVALERDERECRSEASVGSSAHAANDANDDKSIIDDEIYDCSSGCDGDEREETPRPSPTDVNMQIDLGIEIVNNESDERVDVRLPKHRHEARQAAINASQEETKQTDCAKCQFCFVAFGSSIQRFAHETEHDAEEKPFRCDFEMCRMSFKTRSTLQKHSALHLEKKFQCHVCEQRFHQLGNLRSHARYHTGERPFVCEKCGATFYESGALKAHLRRHSGERPFACPECPKQFARSSALKIHRRTHTKEKPYACDECDKRFVSSGKLLMHKRTKSHSGRDDRPFNCDTCSATFVDKYHLVKHKQLRHP